MAEGGGENPPSAGDVFAQNMTCPRCGGVGTVVVEDWDGHGHPYKMHRNCDFCGGHKHVPSDIGLYFILSR